MFESTREYEVSKNKSYVSKRERHDTGLAQRQLHYNCSLDKNMRMQQRCSVWLPSTDYYYIDDKWGEYLFPLTNLQRIFRKIGHQGEGQSCCMLPMISNMAEPIWVKLSGIIEHSAENDLLKDFFGKKLLF